VSLDARHAVARRQRRVEIHEGEDGMAELYALLPAEVAYAIKDRLHRISRITRQAEPRHTAETATTTAVAATAATAGDAGGAATAGDAAAAGGAATAAAVGDAAAAGGAGVVAGERVLRSLDEIRADTLSDLLLHGN